ncbi:sodium:proton antiporter [Iamia sp. SCSIO 61187]|uniref:cation:proton antiporter n=1 Tax=Iamia sp. SCSIO 61187 TaxID=2722752 RepID=UPI001C62FBA6|nr:cation:proton antiporter [Iamia sp. SCSIO 61187]QYG92558.1 sodium:proton antiporter [Iamia sp. SCSIO 61187]
MDGYALALTAVGAAVLGASLLPLVLAGRPLSFPMVYVGAGMILFLLPIDLPTADPLAEGDLVERLAELTVIVSLMGAGLQLDRPFGWRSWRITWRLLAITMPVTIGAIALLGWWALGLAPAAALLLGAAIAPTDPVLASDVQVGPPSSGEESEVRFSLTSEAGLNDGLAFPFTNAAIAAAGAATLGDWVGGWLLEDVLLKIAVGLVGGYLGGRVVGWVVFRLPSERKVAETTEGFVAVAATLLVYGATELAHGYGFLAVFVGATVLRDHERDHEYHEVLHASAEGVERLLSGALLVLLGGAIIDGAFASLGWREAAVGLAIVVLVRPLAGWLGLVRAGLPTGERWAISFFGIRGIGSVYYLAHAINEESALPSGERLWAVAAFVILVSVVLHGASAAPALRRIDA